MKEVLEKKTLFIGIDETNHGREDEIYVATFSDYPQDKEYRFYQKLRAKKDIPTIRNLINEFSNNEHRDYSFVIVTKEIQKEFNKNVFNVAVISLLSKLNFENIFNLEIFLDGEFQNKTIQEIRQDLANVYSFDRDHININYSKKEPVIINMENRSKNKKESINSKYCTRLVYVADSIAFYLFRKCTYANLINSSHRREIIAYKNSFLQNKKPPLIKIIPNKHF